MPKPQRWYLIEGGQAFVYDDPDPARASFVSIVTVPDLAYYRARFDLRKCWPAV